MSGFDVTAHTPYDDEPPCAICHCLDCECPECEVCGVVGDPDCINTHMPWKKWGHFSFKPTKDERENDAKRMEWERRFYRNCPECSHLADEHNSAGCFHTAYDLGPPCACKQTDEAILRLSNTA